MMSDLRFAVLSRMSIMVELVLLFSALLLVAIAWDAFLNPWQIRSLDGEDIDLAVPIKPTPLINLPDVLLTVSAISMFIAAATVLLS